MVSYLEVITHWDLSHAMHACLSSLGFGPLTAAQFMQPNEMMRDVAIVLSNPRGVSTYVPHLTSLSQSRLLHLLLYRCS